jgi:uncharacterized protein (TIGR00255 family)
MIRSMTGFGRADAVADGISVTVEARSVNHRHLDIVLRLPRTLAPLELDARRIVQARVERGRVEVAVQLAPAAGAAGQAITVDAALARQYVEHARGLARETGVDGDVTLSWLLDRPGVVRIDEVETPAPEAVWPVLAGTLGRAMDELVGRREAEGDALGAELRALHADLTATIDLVASRVPSAAARKSERLRERLAALLGESGIDEARVVTEVAVWADRTDVTEELARLRAHLEQFTQVLDKGGAVGRHFDFLLQELNREVNTIAAKGDDLEISQAAIGAKSVIEKMREQVQNLE